jgi:ABC-2 type transport system permease protein
MQFEIFRRAFNDLVKPLLKGWGAALGLYSLILAGTGKLLLQAQMPDRWTGFLGVLKDITGQNIEPLSPEAWYNLGGFGLSLPLFLSLFSVWVGSQLLAREEETGSLALLLAYPIRRGRILLEKYAVLPAGLLVLSLILWAALAIFSLAAGFGLQAGQLALACLNASLLALAFGTAAFTLGVLTGSTVKSRQVSLAAILVLYFVYRIPDLLPKAAFLKYLSPFTYALHPTDPGGLITGPAWAALGLILVLAAAGWRGFEQGDLEI